MALKRYVTEMGMGTDVHGGDYTKAAKRAISDAIRPFEPQLLLGFSTSHPTT